MAVDDHGLEVLKKAGFDIGNTPKKDYAIQVRESDLKVIIEEHNDQNTYIGKALAGTATSAASWQIVKLHKDGSITTKLSADGDFNFDNVWDNRASLNYS